MRNLKRITKRALAGTLAALLLFTSAPTNAYAIEPMDTTGMEQNVAVEEIEELLEEEFANEGEEVLDEQSEVSAEEIVDENEGEQENTETPEEVVEENPEAENTEVDEEGITDEETPEEELSEEELSEEELLEEELLEEELLEELSEDEVISEEVEALEEAPSVIFDVTPVAADAHSKALHNDQAGLYQKNISINKYDGAEAPKIGSISGSLYALNDSFIADYLLALHLESDATEGSYAIYLDDTEVPDTKKTIMGSGVDIDVAIPVTEGKETLSVKYFNSKEEVANTYIFDLDLTFGEDIYLTCEALTELPSGLPAGFPNNIELAGIQNISAASYSAMYGDLYDVNGKWYVFGKISTSVEDANIFVKGNLLNTSDGTFAVEVDRNSETLRFIDYCLYLGPWKSIYMSTLDPWGLDIEENLARKSLVTASAVSELPAALPQDIASAVDSIDDIQVNVIIDSQSVSGTLIPVNEKFYLLGKLTAADGFTVSVENNLITEPATGEFLVDLTSADAKLSAIVKKDDTVVRTIDYNLTMLKKPDIAKYIIYPYSTPKQKITVKMNEDGTGGTIEGTIEAAYDDGDPYYLLGLGVSGANFTEKDEYNVISVKTDAGFKIVSYESAYFYEINPSSIPEKIIVSLDDSKPFDSNIINDPLEFELKLTLIDTIDVNVDLAPATEGGYFDGESLKNITASVNGISVNLEGAEFMCNAGDTYAITMEVYDGAKIAKLDITTGSGNPKTVKVNKQKYTYTGVAGKDDVNITIYGDDPVIGNIGYSDGREVGKDKNDAYYVQKGKNYVATISTASHPLYYDSNWDNVIVLDSEGLSTALDITSYSNEYCYFKVDDSIVSDEIYSMVFSKGDKEISTIKFSLMPTNKLKLTLSDLRTNKKVTSFSIQNGSYAMAKISTVPLNASLDGIGLKVLNSKGEEVQSDGSDGIAFRYEGEYVEFGAVPASKDAKDRYTAVFYDTETGDTIAKYPITYKPAKMGKPIITFLGADIDNGLYDFSVQYPTDMVGDYGEYYYQYVWKNADEEVICGLENPYNISEMVLDGDPITLSNLPSDDSSKYTLEVSFIKEGNAVYAKSTATYTLSNRFANTSKDFKVKQVSKSGYFGQEVVLAKIEYAKDVAYRGKPTLEVLNVPAQMSFGLNMMLNETSEYDESTGEFSIQLLDSDAFSIVEAAEVLDFSKIKLRIRPDVPGGCYSSIYKDINFSINIPIMDIDINPDPIDIVKRPGKAATGKFSLDFNQFNGLSLMEMQIKAMIAAYLPKGVAPKTKKVEYELLDNHGNPVEGITVKNGKISVSKDYVIQGESYDEAFDLHYDMLRLYIAPDDFEGHIWGEVPPFEVRVYADSVKYAEVVPVIYDHSNNCYVRLGSNLSKADLYWSMEDEPQVFFLVRPSNVPVKDRYGYDELIWDGFTLSSSNKNVKLEKIEGVYVISTPIPVAKNVVFTAKSNGDAKNSAKSGKINIVSEQREDFGIYLNNQYLYYGDNEVIDATKLDLSEMEAGPEFNTVACLQVCGLDSAKNIEDFAGQGDFTVKYTNLRELPSELTSMMGMMFADMTYVMPKDISKPVVVTVKDNILRKSKKFTINFKDNEIKATCNDIIYNSTNPGIELYGALTEAWGDYCEAEPEDKPACKEHLAELVEIANLPKYRIDLTIPKKMASLIDEGAYLTMPNAQMDMLLNKDLFSFEAGISMATSFINPDAVDGRVPIYKDDNGYYTYFGWIDEIATKAGKYTVGMAIMDEHGYLLSGLLPITVTLKNQKVNFKAPKGGTAITFNGKEDVVDLNDVVTLGKGCEGIVPLSLEDSLDDGLPTGFNYAFEINEEGKLAIRSSAQSQSLETINECGTGYIKYFVTNSAGVKTFGYLKVKITVTE